MQASRLYHRGLHTSSSLLTAAQPVPAARKWSLRAVFAHTQVQQSTSVVDDVIVARGTVFGDVEGDGRRSGRKWLRRPLRGPAAANYYGLSFRDLAPNFITSVKENVFRYEQMLNRGGKTRITGKQKPFVKPLVDTMKFEEEMQSVSGRGGRGKRKGNSVAGTGKTERPVAQYALRGA